MQGSSSYMGSFTGREEFPSLFVKSHLKLRMGGSRSSLASKLLTDTITKQPRQRRTSAVSSQEHTQSPDSQSVDMWSTASSVSSDSSDIVRIVGRGGAGARRRNYPKEQYTDSIVRPPTSPTSTDSQEPQSNPTDASAFRTIGRGGLGSRPRIKHAKSKSTSSTRQPTEMEVVVMRKLSKRRKGTLYVDELPSRTSEQTAPTISNIHFAGETGLPPPDFFCNGTRRKIGPTDEIEEDDELHSSPIYRTLGDLPNADALNDILTKDQPPNLRWKSKSKRRERLSLLFSIFQSTTTTSGTRKSATMAHGASSHSSIPSQLTLTSIETNPSYFFHGSFSPPSTPLCLTDSIGHSDELHPASGSSLRKEILITSSNPKNEPTEVNGENNHESTTAPLPLPRLKHNPPLTRQRCGLSMRLSPSEAGALFGPPVSLSDTPFAMNDDSDSSQDSSLPPPGVISDVDATTPGAEKQSTWTGEWNTGLNDAIRALRVLR